MADKLTVIELADEGRKPAEHTDLLPVSTPEPTPPVAHDPPNARGRDAKGRYLPAHRLNVLHGLSTDRLPPGLEHLQLEVDAFIAGSLVDEGDQEEIPTRRRSELEYRARLHRRILQLDAALDQRGLIDPRGRLRAAWLTKLESLIAAALSIDRLLGLDRRRKDLNTMDVSEILATIKRRGGENEHVHAQSDTETGPNRTDTNSIDSDEGR
jgi:hypothetical protein